jgi:hypothetical protein
VKKHQKALLSVLDEEYADYVEHPRYGHKPRFTGLNPRAVAESKVFIHWHSPKECRIANTAVAADLSRQTPGFIPVSHYFDVRRKCVDCDQMFIFFAEEQKHWYEELGFGLDSDCVRCVNCRKRQQGIAIARERYEELFHIHERSVEENLEMAACCLTLIESNTFSRARAQQVRSLFNRIRRQRSEDASRLLIDLTSRLHAIEKD